METPTSPSDKPPPPSFCIEDEEHPEAYSRGGYLALRPDEKLENGRYVIKRKLGWGAFAIVWLAEDTLERRHVALKVSRSDKETQETARAEIDVLDYTASHYRQSAHIVTLLRHFTTQNPTWPEEQHIVLVFELLGPNLYDFLQYHIARAERGEIEPGEAGGLPMSLIKRFADQLLEGAAFLHDLCRHIHTDLKPENLAIHIPNIEEVVRKELAKTTPQSALLKCTTRPPVEIFHSQPISIAAYATAISPKVTFADNVIQHDLPDEDSDTRTLESHEGTISSSLSPSFSGSSNGSAASEPISISIPIKTCTRPATSPRFSLSGSWGSTFATNVLSVLSSKFSPPSARDMPHLQTMSPPAFTTPLSPPASKTPLTSALKSSDKPQSVRVKPRPVAPSKPPMLSLKIVDFGNAQPMSEHFTGRIQTRHYRAPEVILGRRDWEFMADMWSIACVLYELATGKFLFDPAAEGGPSGSKDLEHIMEIFQILGPEGTDWQYRGPAEREKMKGTFDQWTYDRIWAKGGRLPRRVKILDSRGEIPAQALQRMRYESVEERLVGFGMERQEAKAFGNFLLPMLRFDPKARRRAADMRDHPWLAN